MVNNASISKSEVDEIRNRLDWVDEERRKSGKRLSELERLVSQQKRIIESRETAIQELEARLASTSAQLTRLSQVDEQLQQFKNELSKMVEENNQRRIKDLEELDKVRQIENEGYQREFSEIRKALTGIKPLEEEIGIRQTEEARLSALIGSLQNQSTRIESNLETANREIEFVRQAGENTSQSLTKLEGDFIERLKRIESIEQRLDGASYGITKTQSIVQELEESVADLRVRVGQWTENIQTGEFERNQKINNWTAIMEEYQEIMSHYAQEWVKFTEQHKVSQMTVKTLEEWQKQVEKQQNEASEITRIEANRMKTLWDNYVAENEKKWRNFEVDQEQRWSGAERREKQVRQDIQGITETLDQFQQDKDTLWRVQSAQAEAMKKWPRILLEEVEKAIAHDPESRRQPALVPVREE